ncbi:MULTISPECIES: prenyltransferase [Halococcus]|uniref:1,4-dihydroxy-2-naphthoate octaprenyltransferase n=1 Tax=Halococcus salifodinae DSM 8989 TaxID=1227456 RepID=M0NBZ7_9EURY|nr:MULTISPECIES: prenyltransferase [Halococcus]EMA55381.1 1,4-dihydroxy-2-naphthoate octaprenyltransferase [Halococcus salifodinae DSM 8989]
MSRPAQLLLVLVVYALGAKIALSSGASLDVVRLAVGGAALLAVAASVHYANEYADHETDALTERTPFSGGSGALARTGLSQYLALYAGIATLAIGMVAAVAGTTLGVLSHPALALLTVIAWFGWQYSVGPLRLAWRGWGELDNAALGGLVLPAYGAAVLDGPVWRTLLACLPFFLLVFANLLATQWPDRHADAAVGKRTLVTRWSPRQLRLLYVGAVCLAFGSLPVLAGSVLPAVVAAASLVVLPVSVWGATGYTERRVPFPSVAAMVALVVVQLLAWCV